jgi:hypothetical protein
MALQCFISKYTSRADLYQVSAEFALERTIFLTTEVHIIMRCKNIEVPAPGIVPVESDAAITGDTTIHFVVDERTEILITMRTLPKARSAIRMPGHDRHVLEVTFTALVAYGAIVRMIYHKPFNDASAQCRCLRVVNGNTHAVDGGRHTRHDNLSVGVSLVFKLLHGALATRTHGMHGWMPAEIGEVETEREAGVQ